MQIGQCKFDVDAHTYVMGILNVTPDSFSDGGRYKSTDAILRRVEQMIAEGADIIDVGGESTRPGYEMISDEEEIARVVPIIKYIKSEFNIPISLDTYKSEVARAGIEAGADLINDIWGLKHDEKMGDVIARAGVACCLMHNRENMEYESFLQDVEMELAESVHLARRAGIAEEKIILDPGVGFAKTVEQNLQIINALDQLKLLGYPILLGASRKSVIGKTLELPVEERLEGTLAASVIAVMKGCAFVRVHDVRENVRAVRMAEAIRRA